MDKFGYLRARRGRPGKDGKDALDLSKWCPSTVVKSFREDEQCTFYFTSEKDGILFDKNKRAIGLADRRGKFNAICLQSMLRPIGYGDHFVLPLRNSLYKITGISSANTSPSIMLVAFTFKVRAPLTSKQEYCIFTNNKGTRSVSINKDSLNIWGAQTMQDLTYKYRGWNSMIIQYSCIGDDAEQIKKAHCWFILNEKRGFFRPRYYADEGGNADLFIGGKPSLTNFADITLGTFEVYLKHWVEEPTDYSIPQEISNLILNDINRFD